MYQKGKYVQIYFSKIWIPLVSYKVDQKQKLICIGLLVAFVLTRSHLRNPLKKMFCSENVIFWGLIDI